MTKYEIFDGQQNLIETAMSALGAHSVLARMDAEGLSGFAVNCETQIVLRHIGDSVVRRGDDRTIDNRTIAELVEAGEIDPADLPGAISDEEE